MMTDSVIHVLSIEDNPVDAELIQEKLAEAQQIGWDLPRFEVEHVARLETALARLSDGAFDVVLSDLDLPDSRAGETVATLREHIPQMPIVVLTGREDEALAQKSVRAGVQDYLYKNEATGSLLARTLMYAIERQQIHGELEQCVEERTAELKDREEHYQSLFENAPISIWEEDFSAVKERIDDLRDSGVRDFSTYFRQHSELVKELAAQVKVLNINRRTLEIYGAKDKSEFYQGLNEVFGEASYEAFIDTLCVIADGDTEFASEKTDQTLEGKDIEVDLQWSVVPGHEDTYSKVLVSIADITERKQAEKRMEHLNRVLRAVRNVNQLITQETDRDRLLQGACDNLTETRGYQSAWITLTDQSGALIATAESGLGEDFLPLVERMKDGHLPLCGERVLAQTGMLSIPDPASSCPECPLSNNYNDHGALFVRLEHGGQVYGWLTVSLPLPFINVDEESNLLQEVAGDIAFALHDIELKEAHRQSVEALRQSEERLRIVLENLPGGVFAHDFDGNLLLVNEAACRNTGYSREELRSLSVADIDPGSRTRDDRSRLWHRLDAGEHATFEATLVRKDGSRYPAEIHLNAVTLDGQPIILALAFDITARKQMEEEIEGERAFLAAVIDNIEEAVIICDDEGRITRFNEAARRLHGVPEQPIPPDQWAEYYDLYREDGTTSLSKEEIPLFRALQGERVHNAEIVVNPEHGEPRSLVCNGQAMVDESGQLTGAVVTMHDVTARKQAERELRQLAAVVDLSPDDIAITDMEGKITYANPAMASLHGLDKAEEAIGTNAFEWFVSPDKAQAAMQETLEKGGITNREFEILNKRGESVPVEMSVTVLWDENDQPTGFAAITRDITARKRAEEALRESEQWLSTTLKSIGDAVIATDDKGQIRLMNPVAESLTGWDEAEALGQPLEDIFHIVNERTGAQVESPASKVFREGKVVGLANHTALINRNGRKYSIADSAAPIEDQDGNIIGAVLIFRDVTERREREKRLAFQSLLLDQIQDMVTATDLEGRITYVNQAECRAFGKTADDLIGQHIKHYGEDARRGATQQEIIETTRTEGEWRGEVVNVTDNGREIVLDCRTRLLHNEHGEPVGMVGISTDITERKRIEEELALQSQLWDALMANTPDLVYFKDADHSIIRASQAYADAVGLDVEEVVGKTTAELWPHEAEEIIADERRVLAGDPLLQKEREVTTASGESRCYLLTKVPIYQDNEVMGFFATDKDITERKRVEEALKESEGKLRGILSSMVDLVFALDREGRYTYYHTPDSGAALYASPDKFMGRKFVEIMPARLRDLFTEAFDKNQEGETADCEYWLEMDGERRWFFAKLSPRIVEGDFVGSVAVVRDITKRKRAEEEIERRAAELKRSNRDLEQFAHVISHDMQEPLRTVTDWLQLLEDRYRGELDEKADKYIDYAVDGAERMQAMIKALLELSRVGTEGKEPAPTEVEAVLERTLKVLRRTIEEAEAEVTHDPLPTVMADEAQLAQVFQNLIANAIKFRKEDVPPRVHVSAEREGDEWVFSVADNGIGIDPQQADRIFQIFQRLHTREEYEGTGIGLALCKRIVERHGGRIWVESEPSEGSTFTFTLPTQDG